mgnify:FL=1
MKESFYPIVVSALSEEDGGGFVAQVPDLYGCMGDGATPEEAVTDALKATIEWCAEMRRLGRDIPEPGSFQEHFHAERSKIRDLIEGLVKELHQVIDAQNRVIDAKDKEIDRLLSRITDLQIELRALDDEGGANAARGLAWIKSGPVTAAVETDTPERRH